MTKLAVREKQIDLAEKLQQYDDMPIYEMSQLMMANRIILRPTPFLPPELVHIFAKLKWTWNLRYEVKKSIWFDTSREINVDNTPLYD